MCVVSAARLWITLSESAPGKANPRSEPMSLKECDSFAFVRTEYNPSCGSN
jgi:hypothetical protein